jgi:hypothetical protein
MKAKRLPWQSNMFVALCSAFSLIISWGVVSWWFSGAIALGGLLNVVVAVDTVRRAALKKKGVA